MPHPAHHPLLDRPGIRTTTEHLQIVIRFQQQHMAALQVVHDAQRHVAEIGDRADFYAFSSKGEANRISSIVRNSERSDSDVADMEAVAGRKTFQLFNLWTAAVLIA